MKFFIETIGCVVCILEGKMKRIGCFLIMSLLFMGCATAEIVMYHDSFHPKDPNCQIDVYDTVMPTKEYIEIARISCADTNDSWNMKQIKKKAREIGADAIIMKGRVGSFGMGVPSGNMVIASAENYGIIAIAIKYK